MPEIALPLVAYCDGSGTHHADSPACIGVVIADATGRILCESSAFVRLGTNNVAEILAIRRTLYLIEQVGPLGAGTPALVRTDSLYAIGFARGDFGMYSGNANHELSATMRAQHARHRDSVTFEHVAGHSGIVGNELADWLAWCARRRHFAERTGEPASSGGRRRPSDDIMIATPVRPPKTKKPRKKKVAKS